GHYCRGIPNGKVSRYRECIQVKVAIRCRIEMPSLIGYRLLPGDNIRHILVTADRQIIAVGNGNYYRDARLVGQDSINLPSPYKLSNRSTTIDKFLSRTNGQLIVEGGG